MSSACSKTLLLLKIGYVISLTTSLLKHCQMRQNDTELGCTTVCVVTHNEVDDSLTVRNELATGKKLTG